MDSLIEKEVIADASVYVDELEAGSEYKVTTTRKTGRPPPWVERRSVQRYAGT